MHLRIFVPWIVLAAVLGFAVGGSFFACVMSDRQGERHGQSTPRQHATGTPPSQEAQAAPKEPQEQPNRDFMGPEWWLVWVTIPLALFTAALFFVTWRLARDAARTAKSEFVATHRPHIRLREFHCVGGPDQPATIRFTVFNAGGSKAIIRGGSGKAEFLLSGRPLPPPTFVAAKDIEMMDAFDAGAIQERVSFPLAYTGYAIEDQNRSGPSLFFYGYIAYADEMGHTFLTAFCRVYNPSTFRFRKVDDPDYEYED
jgi:hypothetical protein